MSKVNYSFSKQTKYALEHFANLLSIARKNQSMTKIDLTDRLGVSRSTVDKMLRGEPTVNIGYYFEAARILRINLFDSDPSRLEDLKRSSNSINSLLPKRVRVKKIILDTDF